MRNSVLPIMGVLTVVAAAVGLQIGESAIAQIDPTYFQGATTPPHDVTKDPRPQREPGFAQASGWAQGYAARAEDCGDCPALLARQSHAAVYAAPAYVDATIQPRWEQADAAGALAVDEEQMVRSIEASRINRYLHYPVSADQAETRRDLGTKPAPAPGAEGDGPIGL